MTELVLTALYYGLWLALFLVIALLVFSAYFLLKSAWKRGWIKKAWRGIKRAAIWLWAYVERLIRFLAKMLVRFFRGLFRLLAWTARLLPKLPKAIAKVVGWMGKKIGIIFGILFMLSLFGIAFGMFLWALNVGAQAQYEGLLIVEFFKWGVVVIAGAIGLAAAIPFFVLVRKLAG